jgi:hypothetical protein
MRDRRPDSERARPWETLELIQKTGAEAYAKAYKNVGAIDSLAVSILLCAGSRPILSRGVQRRPTWRDYYQ